MADTPLPTDSPDSSTGIDAVVTDAPVSGVLVSMATRFVNDVASDRSQYFARELIDVLMTNEFDHDVAMRAVAEARQAGHTYVDVINASKVLTGRDLPVREDNLRSVVAGFLRAEDNIEMVLDATELGVHIYATDIASVMLFAAINGDTDAGRVFDSPLYDEKQRTMISSELVSHSFGWGERALRAESWEGPGRLALIGRGMDTLTDDTSIVNQLEVLCANIAWDLSDTPLASTTIDDVFAFLGDRDQVGVKTRASRALLGLKRGEDLIEAGVMVLDGDDTIRARKVAYTELGREAVQVRFGLASWHTHSEFVTDDVLKPMGFSRKERRALRAEISD